MKKLTAISLVVVIFAVLFSGCGKKEKEPEVILKTENEVLEEIKGNYFDNDALEMFKETKSAIDSFKGLYVMRIDENYQVMVGDGHQGASVGTIKNVKDTGEHMYQLEAKKDGNNYFKASYFPGDDLISATVKTDFSGDGKEKNLTYCKFASDKEIIKTLTLILFENVEGVIRENDSIFAEIDGIKYELAVSYSTVEVKAMYPDCLGGIMLKGEGGKTISAAYKQQKDKMIIENENGEVLLEMAVK